MCACRNEMDSDPPTPLSPQECGLEDLYPLLEMSQGEGEGEGEEGDVYSLLAQKERDLMLAAELGKALLEKNEELNAKNEQMAEEYSQSLEALEQEKYELHLRLEQRETEFTNTVKELHEDIAALREELRLTQQHCVQGDQERSHTIRDLVKQNEQLAEQARQSSCREEELEVEMHHLRGQVDSRRSTMHEHLTQLDMFRDQIEELQRQKGELERKTHSMTEERRSLLCSLEESQERIHALEEQNRGNQEEVYRRQREIRELQETNTLLQARIDHLSSRHRSPDNNSNHSQTLYNELSELSNLELELQAAAEAGQLQLESWQRSMSAEMLDEDDFECDDEGLELGAVAMGSISGGDPPQFFYHSNAFLEGTPQDSQLKGEMHRACQMVKTMMRQIRGEDGDHCSDHESSSEPVKTEELTSLLTEFQQLLQKVMMSQQQTQSGQCFHMGELQQQVAGLQEELGRAHRHLTSVHSDMQDHDRHLQQRCADFAQMAAKLRRQQQELMQLQQERDALQDRILGDASLDDVLKQTRQERDEAWRRCQDLQMELSQAQMEIGNLSQQLIGVIQQKVNISQELDQWQVDMEELLDVQIQRRMDQEQAKEKVEAQLLQTAEMKKSASVSSFFKSSEA